MTKSPTNLWRGVRVEDFPSGVIIDEDPAEEILYPDFERKQIGKKRNGAPKYREPDVEVVKGIVQTGGGTSLFNKDKFFNGKSWQYFYIPEGTEIDPRLKLTGPEYNDYFKADHYQIEVDKQLRIDSYKGALDNLARAAIKKAYEDARK
jgi:hypothetical protein